MVHVGDEIESVCGKCGDVWHVVAAMIGSKVVKVVCKRCGGQHRHRPPTGAGPAAAAAEKAEAPAKPAKTTEKKMSKKAAAAAAAEAAAAAPVEPDLSRPIKPYKPSDRYQLRDRIEHRTFGVGVVEEVASAGKIQVRFPEGSKKLLHGAPAA